MIRIVYEVAGRNPVLSPWTLPRTYITLQLPTTETQTHSPTPPTPTLKLTTVAVYTDHN